MQYAIRIRNIKKTYKASKKYPAKDALKGFDLDIPQGAMFALLGPNGAGKSTLINIMAGIVNKTAGSIEIWGIDIDKDHRQAKSAIGVVPQEIIMDPSFTPFEVVEDMAGLYGIKKSDRRTEAILKSVGLWDKRDAYQRTLSGGMKRRLMIAKAMAHNPPILVLDEPTAGVDIELRRQLWDNVRHLNKQGATIILTTHYLEEAEQLCDYIAIINHGELVANDSKHNLLKSHKTKGIQLSLNTPFDRKHTPQNTTITLPDTRDNTIEITYQTDTTTVGNILSHITNSGYEINDMTTQQANLEQLFLNITKHP